MPSAVRHEVEYEETLCNPYQAAARGEGGGGRGAVGVRGVSVEGGWGCCGCEGVNVEGGWGCCGCEGG